MIHARWEYNKFTKIYKGHGIKDPKLGLQNMWFGENILGSSQPR